MKLKKVMALYAFGLVAAACLVSQFSFAAIGNGRALRTVEGNEFDFGSVSVDSAADHVFTIVNENTVTGVFHSNEPLSAPFSFKGGADFPGEGGTCSGTGLAPGESCTYIVTFDPTSVGLFDEELLISYFFVADSGAAQGKKNLPLASLNLSGTGVEAQTSGLLSRPGSDDLVISDGSAFQFPGTVAGNSAVHALTVYNFGDEFARLEAIIPLEGVFSYLGGSFPGTGGTCDAQGLAPNSRCQLVISFSSETIGIFSGELKLVYSYRGGKRDHEVLKVSLGANSISPLVIGDVPFYDYGLVTLGASSTHDFYVTNLSTLPVTGISSLPLPVPYTYLNGSFPGTGGTCTGTLAGGAACTVKVRFAPTEVGTFEGPLTLNYLFGEHSSIVTVDLFGKGRSGPTAAVNILADDPVVNFGSVQAGATQTHTFTVSNNGSATATSLAGEALSAPFSYLGGSYPGTGGTCSATLVSGTTCTIVLSFAPTVSGAYEGILTLNYFSGAVSYKSKRAFVGAAP